MKDLIKFNILHSVTLPKGRITNEGQHQICNLMHKTSGGLIDLNEPTYGLEWTWMAKKGGAITKRILKIIRDKIKSNPAIFNKKKQLFQSSVAEIGRIAATHSFKVPETIYIDFSDKINWAPGMFGDRKSCLYTTRRIGLQCIQDNGFVMRTWSKEPIIQNFNFSDAPPNIYPTGRCWGAIVDDNIVIWNGYGKELVVFAQILHVHLNLEYKPVRLVNNGESSGEVYINGSQGYFFSGDPGYLSRSRDLTIDLNWDLTKYKNSLARCSNCNRQATQDDKFRLAYSGGYAHIECVKKCLVCKKDHPKNHFGRIGNLEMCLDCTTSRIVKCSNCKKDVAFLEIPKTQKCDDCAKLPSCASCGRVANHNEKICRSCHLFEDVIITIGKSGRWVNINASGTEVAPAVIHNTTTSHPPNTGGAIAQPRYVVTEVRGINEG